MIKNFLITGASSEIGTVLCKEIKRQYELEGKLFMVSRSENKELAKLQDINTVYHHGVDLLDLANGDNVVSEIEAHFDGPFTLIHCAGDYWSHYSFLDFSTKKAKQMMDSHYGTLYNVLQVALPVMVQKGGGKILTFSCNSTGYHFPNMLPFTAAKAAVDATIKCIAHEYAGQNIVANSIALASLKTPQNKITKPFGDYDHYIELDALTKTVLEIAELSNNLVNGNVINCYEYSESYYEEGYFQRTRQK